MAFIITSRDFGAWTNGIRVSVVRDTLADPALPISWPGSGASVDFRPWTVVVEFPAEKKKYSYRIRAGVVVNAENGGTFTVSSTDRSITLEYGANTETVDFDRVSTLKALADWINNHTGVTATVIGSSWLPVEILNDGTDNLSAGKSLFHPAEDGLAVYLLNTQCPLVSAGYSASAAVPGPLTALSPTYLNGGQGRGSDTMESTGLTRAIDLAETTSAHLVFLQSSDSALQQLVLAHCAEMSTVERRKYRVLVTGINFAGTSPVDGGTMGSGAVDDAVEAACTRAKALDGPCVLCFNGTTTANPVTGVSEQLGGLGLAAQVVGMAAGAYVAIPLTNKPVISQGLEFPYLKDSHIEALLDAGVLAVTYNSDEGRTLIEQAVTCYQTTNPAYRNFQGLRIQHQINRMWIRVLAKYVGWPLDLETGERIKADCAKGLDDSIRSGNNPAGFLTDGMKNGQRIPAWDSLRVVGDSTVGAWTISTNAHPVGETDFIVVRTKLTPAPIEL